MDGPIRLREWRQSRLLSLRELARTAGVAVSTVSEVEQRRREPNWRTLRKLAAALGIETASLYREPGLEG